MATIAHTLILSVAETSNLLQASAPVSFTQSGTGYQFNVQSIGTSSELLSFGDLANVTGGLLLTNTDATNYVEIDSGTAFDKFPQKLLPGRSCFLTPQTSTIYAKANTAAVILKISAAVA